ncbi:MAG TPA: YfbM family protein [Kineosporiaceae bacterium]
MGCLGVHFAVPAGVVARLVSAGDDEVRLIVEDIEEEMTDVDHCDTDKAWDAIRRCLTDGDLGLDNGDYRLNAATLGGRHLHGGEDYIVSLLTPDQVRDVAQVLAEVPRETLRARYLAIDPDDYGPEFGDEDFDYTWENFTDLVAFFHRCALAGSHVIFTVDQ